jgi:hypothetical protein
MVASVAVQEGSSAVLGKTMQEFVETSHAQLMPPR